jgi:hypothetical protein
VSEYSEDETSSSEDETSSSEDETSSSEDDSSYTELQQGDISCKHIYVINIGWLGG